jgi:hypothetical protein
MRIQENRVDTVDVGNCGVRQSLMQISAVSIANRIGHPAPTVARKE